MMNNSYPKWMPEDFAEYVSHAETNSHDYPFNTIDIEITRALCRDSGLHKEFWQRFDKLRCNNKMDLTSPEQLFTSLLLTIEHGKSHLTESWDTKTAKAREREIERHIKILEEFRAWHKQLAPEYSPVWQKLRSPREVTAKQHSAATELENDLNGLTVLRPFIAPEFIQTLDMQIDLLYSSLFQLNPVERSLSSKTENLAPFRSTKPQETYLIRCLAYWFTKYFGSPKTDILCDLASIILDYPVNIDYAKGAIRESKALKKKK